MSNSPTEKRKQEHINICLEQKVEPGSAGFENYRFVHEALPEINLDEVDTRCSLFGHKLSAPLIISSMTGGCGEGGQINQVLAEAAQTLGLAMGVGSQRAALTDPELASTFQVRKIAPNIALFANLGAVQLNNGFSLDECKSAIEMISADALILHINPLQESIQPGGNTNYSDLLKKIEMLCKGLNVPVIVKEVGNGISERTARLIREAGAAGIDTAGAGGTSWAIVESLRHSENPEVGNEFASWGIPTAESIKMCRKGAPNTIIIGSGGLRSGIDAAKAIALGADFAGYGLPLLKDAVRGIEPVINRLKKYRNELQTAMFCIGAKNIIELRGSKSLMHICPTCGTMHL